MNKSPFIINRKNGLEWGGGKRGGTNNSCSVKKRTEKPVYVLEFSVLLLVSIKDQTMMFLMRLMSRTMFTISGEDN